jgi:DNA polymerase-4
VGVAPNKLLAKMASEFNKPNGISVVHESDLQHAIWPLPCRKINGIGPKAESKLKALGIETIGQLAECDPFDLMEHFGRSQGAWLHEAAWGRDDRPVETQTEPVSISRETTFERDLHAVHDRSLLTEIFTRLCEQLANDLGRKGYVGRTVGIKLRYDNFQSVTRDVSVDAYTADPHRIRQLAGQCLKRVDLDRRFRLLGVRVGSLMQAQEWQAILAHESQPGQGENESLF